MTQGGRPRFAAFLAFLTEQAEERRKSEAAILAETAPHLAALVAEDDWLDEAFARPDASRYQQHLLFCDPLRRFSVVSFVWGPGQATPIHDHMTWGLVGMLRGAEISEGFALRSGVPVKTGEVRLEPGDVIALSPAEGDIHRVRNAHADRVSISIHVYGDDIGRVDRHIFSPDGDVKGFVSGYSNVLLPNLWGRA
jgi:predicted metal-dependent enzyme (double-stranded beta helix superfamily)